MDNSPMYDQVTWNASLNKMLIYDVGMTGEWLGEVASNAKKYGSLASKNPPLNPKGSTLCGHIAKKVSSWFASPADPALLIELVKDYELSTQATTPVTILKALLVVLLSRGFDLNPEHLLVSRSDIMALMKQS